MSSFAEEFRKRIAATETRLARLSEEQWSRPYRADSWLRKEVLGHLVDSAANNHVRFVTAALNGSFTGPGYDQNGWVRIHSYGTTKGADTLSSWRSQNSLLSLVVANLSDAELQAQCQVSDDPPMTLREVIVSYLDHMEHHVQQIMEGI